MKSAEEHLRDGVFCKVGRGVLEIQCFVRWVVEYWRYGVFCKVGRGVLEIWSIL